MTTERAHAAEEEYFRNREAEQRREETWQQQREARAEQTGRQRIEARRLRQAARSEAAAPEERREGRRGLNRLIVATWGEILALEEASRIVQSPGRRKDLLEKADRRQLFRRDLDAAVLALGGVPAQQASLFARTQAWARSLRRLLIGPHGGDAYATCAHAAAIATNEYARVLRTGLPHHVRFSLERQQAEVELDYQELRRLRWGASPATYPAASGATAEPLFGIRP